MEALAYLQRDGRKLNFILFDGVESLTSGPEIEKSRLSADSYHRLTSVVPYYLL